MANQAIWSSGNDFVHPIHHRFGGVKLPKPAAGLPQKEMRQEKKREQEKINFERCFKKHPNTTGCCPDEPGEKRELLNDGHSTYHKDGIFPMGVKTVFSGKIREKSKPSGECEDKGNSRDIYQKENENDRTTEKNEYHNETRGNSSQEPHNLTLLDFFFDPVVANSNCLSILYTAMLLRLAWEFEKSIFGLCAFVCGFWWGMFGMLIWELVSPPRD